MPRDDYDASRMPQQYRDWSDGVVRQAEVLKGMPLPLLRGLWDQYDGANAPEGWEGEAIHLALNLAGDGGYCAV